ncbi:MAG: hypothetical protein KAJ36_00795 [Candidatus Thorarchaeota archaeon]|nr:hypothetical protein [Candidatus Thorarchaeota archaeon]
MKLKGIDKLREKLPAYPGRKIYLLPLKGAVAAALAYIFLIGLDILPRLFSDIPLLVTIEPVIPILGSIFIGTIAISLVGTLWRRRDSMKSQYGQLSYQMMISKGAIGIGLIMPVIFHAATSIHLLPPVQPVNDLTSLFSSLALPLLGVTPELDFWIRLVLSGIILVVGMLIVRSTIFSFGIDYMAVVYLYFPEESEVQDHEIYSVVRHPVYMGGIILGAAAMIFNFSVYSILFFVIVYLIFKVQIRREERELIERFGDGYAEYREKVPALHVRPRDFRAFFKFLRQSIRPS